MSSIPIREPLNGGVRIDIQGGKSYVVTTSGLKHISAKDYAAGRKLDMVPAQIAEINRPTNEDMEMLDAYSDDFDQRGTDIIQKQKTAHNLEIQAQIPNGDVMPTADLMHATKWYTPGFALHDKLTDTVIMHSYPDEVARGADLEAAATAVEFENEHGISVTFRGLDAVPNLSVPLASLGPVPEVPPAPLKARSLYDAVVDMPPANYHPTQDMMGAYSYLNGEHAKFLAYDRSLTAKGGTIEEGDEEEDGSRLPTLPVVDKKPASEKAGPQARQPRTFVGKRAVVMPAEVTPAQAEEAVVNQMSEMNTQLKTENNDLVKQVAALEAANTQLKAEKVVLKGSYRNKILLITVVALLVLGFGAGGGFSGVNVFDALGQGYVNIGKGIYNLFHHTS